MTIRWGIVSAGKISHDFVNAFNSFPDVGDQVIAAVAARDKSRANEFAKIHKIPKVFGSYNEMANSDAIDVAYIGALNPDHYELSKLFLESGKHVLCEKPICLNYKETESLFNIAKSKNLFLMEAVWSRFAPCYIALEKEIQSGKLGDIQFVEVNFGVPIENVDRLRKKDMGGSAILDIGIYTLQFAQFIFKEEPIKVTAVGDLNSDGVDLVETIILEYSGNRRAVLNVNSKILLWNKATVYGTQGRITVEDPFHFPDTLVHPDGTAGLVFQTLEVTRCIKQGLNESPRMSRKESLLLVKLRDTVRKQLGVHFDVDDKEF
ncbi:trans-1,2-dihydrobenzene-1,2-diol dehydrogenase-like isoform X2 [Melitaea cinxia]|uniref:trans-1,2-dihydrobenzene-1,2-diol dehydrogenase-like isoform X2 n=1 Tax=Melitaea cinxia TaxID=113334 RepID=UPI001E271A4B|nr:trans-1,2-dihydrobenzene-1,2-diol dehydrogenase-like isoform X2 [Melitaea cinxia]